MRAISMAICGAATAALTLSGCGASDQPQNTSSGGSMSASTPADSTPTGAATTTGPTPSGATGSSATQPTPGRTTAVPDDPTPTTGSGVAKAQRLTATGKVSVEVADGRCVSMTIQGQAYVLVGAGVQQLSNGAQVSVTGYGDPTLTTTCQGGPAFVVESIQTATN